ncbi:MAG: Gfo/Idh/MocA family oxidoreductase [Phycisphaerae bacterium]|nr:Gfo/Idh/MocA family oxidoreductase [Phycisphaerae bacterium]
MSHKQTRRAFIRRSALALTGTWAAGAPALAEGGPRKSPNERLGIGVIGLGGRGTANLMALRGEHIVAACDADERQAAGPRRWIPKAQFYTDFRRMFDRKDIDAVMISTPDHTHAPATMMALKAGKHVYCEKPLTHSIYEARKLTEQAAKTKCVTQMGIQMHASTTYARVVELIRAGAIGDVTDVHVWHRSGYAPGDRPKDTPAVPEGLHYDEWLGPAPYRPYNPAYLPGSWRGWWDFGSGLLGDFGCHLMDLPHWALGLRHVRKVSAEGPPVHPESTPKWLIVRYEYPAPPGKPPVKLTWYNGGKHKDALGKEEFIDWELGILFVGTKGRIAADYNRYILFPNGGSEGQKRSQTFLPDAIRHPRDWVEACKTGGKTACGFDYSGPLTETVLLGNVAYRAGKPIEWDAANLKITNEPDAMRFIKRPYRKGWTL